MISQPKILLLFLAMYSAVPLALAAPAPDGTEVYLAVMGANTVEHGQDRPLLLQVNVFNERRSVTLGLRGKPLAAIVRFGVKDTNNRDVTLAIRPLTETAEKKGTVKLGQDQVSLYFGVEPEALAALAEGDYRIEAFVKDASSPPVTIKLKKSSLSGDDLVGLYYRIDRRFDELMAHAQRMIQKDPNDVAGYIYHGDALAGLGRGREALVPFNKAIEIHKAQSKGAVLVEEPIYVYERINEILEKK